MKTRRAVLIAAVGIAALVGAYAAAGYWLAPKLLRERLPEFVERELGHRLELAALRIDPFRLSAEVEGARLSARDGAPLASFSRLRVDLELDSLWRGAWRLREISLAEPRVDLAIDAEGRLNWSALVDALPKGGGGGKPTPFVIERLTLSRGVLSLVDRSREASADLLVQPIEIEMTKVSTVSGEAGRSTIRAALKGGGSLDWQGGLSLEPLALDGSLSIEAVPAATVWRFVDPAAKPPSGTVRAATKVSFHNDPRSLALEALTAQLEELALELTNGERLAIGRLSLAPSRYEVFARSGELGMLQLEALHYGDPAGKLDAKLARAETGAAELRLDAKRIRVGSLTLAEAAFEAPTAPGEDPSHAALERAELGTIEIGLEGPQVAVASATLNGLRAQMPPDAKGAGGKAQLERIATGALRVTLGESQQRALTLERAELTGLHGETAPDARGASAKAQLDRIEAGALRVTLGEPQQREITLERALFSALRIEASPDARGASAKAQLDRLETGALAVALGTPQQGTLTLERAQLSALRGETPPDARGRIARARLERLDAGALRVGLGERTLVLERLALVEPQVEEAFDEKGALGTVRFAERLGPAKPPAKAAAPEKPWRIELGALQATGGTLRLEDHRVAPAGRIDLAGINVKAGRLATTAGKPADVSAELTLKPGAKLAARGTLALEPLRADVRLNAEGISLKAAQPWLTPYMHVRLDSGTLETQGRLRVTAAPARDEAHVAYDGALFIAALKLVEGEKDEEFAALRALQTENLTLRIAPTSISVGELALLEPAGTLQIAEDGSINVSKAFTPREKPAAESTASTEGFEYTFNRVTVENARLAFADSSLKPPFATRIHKLSGTISGITSDPGAAARLQLDGHVDEFGSARIRGTIDPQAPRALTDITLAFRNLPLEALNPYAMKFAGRRVESGRLAADLRYRVRDSKLKGENQLTIERLELGERVEDPEAPNLPLDLAVALLTDSDGRMRLGIPVEGDLGNPQFDTGQVISKAIANAVGKVVTAPFQLLAALLRRDVEELDRLEFEAGSAKLPPPEREKIEALAKALAARPQLALEVQGQFDRKTDAEALRELAVRRTLARRMDIALRPGEDPGPVAFSDPRTAKVAEAMYTERFGEAALKEIKPAAPAADPKALARARTQAMIERLTAQHPIDPGTLEKLAEQRAEAARKALVEAGIDLSRIALGKPEPVEGTAEGVPTRLRLDVR